MTRTVTNTFHNEGKLMGDAAKEVLRKSTVGIGESVRRAGVAFKEGSTTNKLTVVGGISTGVTFALTGARTLRNAMRKDEKTGKRDYASAALGAAELVGGTFVAGLFYERLKMNGASLSQDDKGPSR